MPLFARLKSIASRWRTRGRSQPFHCPYCGLTPAEHQPHPIMKATLLPPMERPPLTIEDSSATDAPGRARGRSESLDVKAE